MITTQLETHWLFALALKFEPLTPLTTILLLLLSWLIFNLIIWAHPGGPAWGRLRRPPHYQILNPSIPGPRGLPFIGSLPLMSGLAHRNLASAAQSHGASRLMAFSLGETRAVVTCHPDVAKEILNSSAFVDRPAKESARRLMFNRSIGFAPYGIFWTTLRKIATAHLFCPKQVKASESLRREVAGQMVAEIESKRHGTHGGILVKDVLKRAALDSMMLTVFGRKCRADSDAAELKEMVDEGYDLLGQLNWSDHFSVLADFDFQNIRFRCSRLVPRVNRFVGNIIAEHETGATCDFVGVLQSLKQEDRLSDSDMISVLWEMIFRGTDTIAVLIEWILARLVLHPDVQAKAHDELDDVVGKLRAVTESDLTELVYITAIVKEVLRIHPPGPLLSWARLSVRDSIVDGYHVPAGTTGMVNMWAITKDPNIWPDPMSFLPDRFFKGSPNFEFSVLGSDLRLAPFGSGRRSCPGKILGMTTVTYWVAMLLHEFEFENYDQSSVKLDEVLRLSCEMANPLVVRVRPRLNNQKNLEPI